MNSAKTYWQKQFELTQDAAPANEARMLAEVLVGLTHAQQLSEQERNGLLEQGNEAMRQRVKEILAAWQE